MVQQHDKGKCLHKVTVFASRCMSSLELFLLLFILVLHQQNFRISSTLLFKAHLALERLDAELISSQHTNMKHNLSSSRQKEKDSPQKEKPHGKKEKTHGKKKKTRGKKKNPVSAKGKRLTPKRKTSRQKEKDSRQKEYPYGKKENLTEKRTTSRQKELRIKMSSRHRINFAESLFLFAVTFFFMPQVFFFLP